MSAEAALIVDAYQALLPWLVHDEPAAPGLRVGRIRGAEGLRVLHGEGPSIQAANHDLLALLLSLLGPDRRVHLVADDCWPGFVSSYETALRSGTEARSFAEFCKDARWCDHGLLSVLGTDHDLVVWNRSVVTADPGVWFELAFEATCVVDAMPSIRRLTAPELHLLRSLNTVRADPDAAQRLAQSLDALPPAGVEPRPTGPVLALLARRTADQRQALNGRLGAAAHRIGLASHDDLMRLGAARELSFPVVPGAFAAREAVPDIPADVATSLTLAMLVAGANNPAPWASCATGSQGSSTS
ncbi:MAG: hypothetical protein JWO88_3586 [Frankiales bacterium]|nr:hypothetical protein [Frankiales bacterium]